MRGRKPIPGPQKKAQGNPGHRPIKPEPQFMPALDDECPIKLDPLARAEWDRVVPELRRLNLFKAVDHSRLTDYCYAISFSRRAAQLIAEEGLAARIGRRSAANYFRDMALLADKLGAKFGLTPSDRARISAPEGEKKDAMEEFLQQGKGVPIDPKFNN